MTKLECRLRSTSRSSSAFLFLVIPDGLRQRQAFAQGATYTNAERALAVQSSVGDSSRSIHGICGHQVYELSSHGLNLGQSSASVVPTKLPVG